jgi:hypothetical protein
MVRKIHGTNFFHITFLDRTNIKIECQNGLVLLPAQVFYFNGQALNKYDISSASRNERRILTRITLIRSIHIT